MEEKPASSVPMGTGSFPRFPMCRSRGPPPALGFGGAYRQDGGRGKEGGEGRVTRQSWVGAPGLPQARQGLSFPAGDVGEKEVEEMVGEGERRKRRRRRGNRRRGGGVGGAAGSGGTGRGERPGAGTAGRRRWALWAHMRTHLPLMRSVLFCLLERLPSMFRLMFRRVSSVSSSWKSSLTL